MDNVFEEYIKFVETFLINYFKLLLGTEYERKLVIPFIDKYLNVRYYNKCVYENEPKFIKRLNKELNSVAKEVITEHETKIEKVKNIFALFSYVMYIDGCVKYSNLNTLMKTLYSDKNITLYYDEGTKKEVNALVREFVNKKISFFNLFKAEEFYLKGKKFADHIYHVDLGQNCNLSKLYSNYAIQKAYDSEVVFENRIYLTLVLVSAKILTEVISLNFTNNYIFDFPVSLLDKPKKIIKFLKMLDSDYIRSKVHLRFKYEVYRKNKKAINNLITQDYSVCVEIDDSFDMNFDNLFLFSYIIVNKESKFCKTIIENKDDVKTTIIVM